MTIPGAVAAQVLGEEIDILSEGTLSLLLMPLPERDHEGQPALTLVVGASAFPLYKTTMFGTLADDSRTYVFTPDVTGANKGCVFPLSPAMRFSLTPNTPPQPCRYCSPRVRLRFVCR